MLYRVWFWCARRFLFPIFYLSFLFVIEEAMRLTTYEPNRRNKK
jgi:hypothetical protein